MKARKPSESAHVPAKGSVAVHHLRGTLKRKPGDKPFAEAWAEHTAEEKALEEAKVSR